MNFKRTNHFAGEIYLSYIMKTKLYFGTQVVYKDIYIMHGVFHYTVSMVTPKHRQKKDFREPKKKRKWNTQFE